MYIAIEVMHVKSNLYFILQNYLSSPAVYLFVMFVGPLRFPFEETQCTYYVGTLPFLYGFCGKFRVPLELDRICYQEKSV